MATLASLYAFAAQAQPAPQPPTPAPTVAAAAPDTYTLQILAVDALSIGTLVLGGALEGDGHGRVVDKLGNSLMLAGVGGLVAGGAVIHARHGHPERSVASLGLRVGLPVAGAAIGAASADCSKDGFLCGLAEAALGFTIGVASAIVIDAAVLARLSAFDQPEERTAEASSPAKARPRTLTIAPQLVATPNVALVGVGGRF